ncbi:MAG TPA: tetratricopeptide repeat protein [Candidatus Acidoferrum sp.]|nr:tetratricopeptide repeat protein [Candidatus Acidoferrum sp.]
MKHSHRGLIAANTCRIAFCGVLFAGAQHVAFLQGGQIIARSQNPPKPAEQSKSQKVSNPLNDLLDEARREMDNNNFEAAISPLQKVIAEQPEFAYAHFQLAYVFTALKKSEEARAEYERTLALDPKMSEAYLNLGILLLEKEPQAAIAPLNKAVELLPSQSRPRFLLGIAQERSGEIAKAADSFEGAVRLDPRDAEALVHLGTLHLQLKRPAEAESNFANALEIQPNEPRALLGLAQSLDAQKKPEAADAFRKYLAVRPADGTARARMVHYLMEKQEYDSALAELDRADAGKPSVESLKLRADIQIAQKKWDDSVVTLRQAVVLAPNDAQLHGGLGRILLQTRDFPAAEKELRTALRLDGKNIDYWRDLSSTLFLGGNYPAALATLDEIAKMEQPGAGAWFIRAICYDKLKQTKPALESYQKFLQLDQGKNPDQVWQAQQRSKVLQRMLEQKR